MTDSSTQDSCCEHDAMAFIDQLDPELSPTICPYMPRCTILRAADQEPPGFGEICSNLEELISN